MIDKNKRQQRRSAEDASFNNMLLWLVGAIIAEAIVLFVKRYYINMTTSDVDFAIATGLSWFFRVFIWAGLALTILGAVWLFLSARKGKKLRLPILCTAAVCFLWILSLLTYFFYQTGVQAMVILPVVAAVLILIFFLYQRAFFVNAIVTGCGMTVLWLYRQHYMMHPTALTVFFAVGWAALLLYAVLLGVMKRNGGKLGKRQWIADSSAYLVSWLTCGVVAVAMLAGFLIGVGAAFYLTFVLVGWFFCLAVYFTVKLM